MLPIEKVSSKDGLSIKYRWQTSNGNLVEAANLRLLHRDYDSLCVSSQVGCRLGCSFCATGLVGRAENLTAQDIIYQVEYMLSDTDYPNKKVQVSFTGMGEPLLNTKAVFTALTYLNTAYPGLLFTLSTTGIVPQIYALSQLPLTVQLRISLHAPNDQLRTRLMPVGRKYDIRSVLEAATSFANNSGIKVIINYLLLQGVNDSPDAARDLVKLLKDNPFRLRLSKLSFVAESGLIGSSEPRFNEFEASCKENGLDVYRFESLGTDIEVGMGQLRSFLNTPQPLLINASEKGPKILVTVA